MASQVMNKMTEIDNNKGTGFLAKSHFKIGQDPCITQNAMRSVFKKDYVPWEVLSKPSAAIPPAPAHILHSDVRHFSQRNSETQTAFEEKSLPIPDAMKDKYQALSATNFKMDKDTKYFGHSDTTQKSDFRPKDLSNFHIRQMPGGGRSSNIPNGDREKAPQPVSDYRDRYRGHDVETHKIEKAGPGFEGPSTIRGDARQHHFDTTHVDTFKGCSLPRVAPLSAPTGSNIPQGDRDKECLQRTVFQQSFVPHDLGQVGQYSKEGVTGKLQKSHMNLADGHGTWNTYKSTFKDSYRPISGDYQREGPAGDRNRSDFPKWDENQLRDMDRASMTTNRFYMGNPAPTQKPHIEDGSAKRTRSNVPFGEPRLNNNFYETTMQDNFKPKSGNMSLTKPDMMTKSVIPLDYYPGLVNNTTMRTDFKNPEQGRLHPNERAIERIRAAHIMPPLRGTQQYSTEHVDQYIPKSTKREDYDPVRLQRSSVPIGTLTY